MADTTRPTVTDTNMNDGYFPVAGNVTITFSEAIQAGSTPIILMKPGGGAVEILYPNSPRVTISGNVLTVDFATALYPNVAYTVALTNSAIKDAAGNYYVGAQFNLFTNPSTDTSGPAPAPVPVPVPGPAPVVVPPANPPQLTAVYPAQTDSFAVDGDIVLTFSEAISLYSIIALKNAATGEVVDSFYSGLFGSSGNFTVNGNELTLNPKNNLQGGVKYALEFSGTAIKDADGNALSANQSLSFTTAARLGTQYADQLTASSGSETIDGLGGTDTVSYDSARAAHTVTRSDSGLSMTQTGTTDTDTLQNVERLAFSDTKVAFDLQVGEAGAMAACFIGALARDALASREVVGVVLDYFDDSYTLEGLSAHAIKIGLVRGLAGSDSNQALAQLVYRNVIGKEGSAAEVDSLLAYMDGRTESYSQAEFIAAVAGHETTLECVGLAGLQLTGLEYL